MARFISRRVVTAIATITFSIKAVMFYSFINHNKVPFYVFLCNNVQTNELINQLFSLVCLLRKFLLKNSAHYFFPLYVIFIFFNYPAVFQFVVNHSDIWFY